MRFLILILVVIGLVACNSTKLTSDTQHYEQSKEQMYESKYEKLYYSLRDSLVNAPAPKEYSKSVGLMDSYLFTSLAESRAWIDSLGMLHHNINNKDSIPTKYILDIRYRDRTDTLYIYKTDTMYVNVYEEATEEPSFWNKIKMDIGDAIAKCILFLIGVLCIVGLVKFFRKVKK